MVCPGWVGKVNFLILGAGEKFGKEKCSNVDGSRTRNSLDRSYLSYEFTLRILS